MHIHILAISGQMTTPLALELKRQGHLITGSDQEKIYPPASTDLLRAQIPLNQTPITKNIDLVIVGSAYANNPKTKQEFEEVKKQKISYISATSFIAQNVIKKKSILVAGSYGKSTIAALLTQIFINADLNPSHLFSAKAVNPIPQLKITNSDWSIVEADESINGLDTQAKFLYYPSKYVILTSADWEHSDSHPTESHNLTAFRQLLQNIPPDGLLIYNPNNLNIQKILSSCPAKTIPYDFKLKFSTPLIGQHNSENITAAYTLCRQLSINETTVLSTIKSFKGIRRRLQLIKSAKNIIFIDDFAQSPIRVQAALNALHLTYPNRPIKVYFEPHASFLQQRSGLKGFAQSFELASEVVLGKIKFNPKITKENRVSAATFAKEVGNKLKYIPLTPQISAHYQNSLQSGDILIHFSSGGLAGLKTFSHIARHFSVL